MLSPTIGAISLRCNYHKLLRAKRNDHRYLYPYKSSISELLAAGKSHKVAKDLAGVSRENVFRTTFHPDYDYASFVGCYKPIVSSPSRQDLSFEELKSRIQEEVDKNPKHTMGKFTIKYYRSIQKLLDTQQKEELRAEIQKCLQRPTNGETLAPTMNLALTLGEYLEKEGLWRDDSTITYAFTPQVFTNALCACLGASQ